MNKEIKRISIQNRIAKLSTKSGNEKIIRKLERQLRNMK